MISLCDFDKNINFLASTIMQQKNIMETQVGEVKVFSNANIILEMKELEEYTRKL